MKIGLITLYRGYNYGSSLQAYALREFIASLGYEAEIIWTKENANGNRDIRCGKLFRMMRRCLLHPQLFKHTLSAYGKNVSQPIDDEIKKGFQRFLDSELQVHGMSMSELEQYAASSDTAAVVCGSDQIWSATDANIDPLYYLRFVPREKRIAYAPSFGSSSVPAYNRKIIRKYLQDFPNISVREKQGADIVRELIGVDVPVLIDPTFLLDWSCFKSEHDGSSYAVLYFLNEPSPETVERIKAVCGNRGMRIVAFPYVYCAYEGMENLEYITPDPKEFISVIGNADCVFTDSFHGTAFSVNLHVPFWVFPRNYGTGSEQSSRITSLLDIVGLGSQYVVDSCKGPLSVPDIDFTRVEKELEEQRIKSREYMLAALNSTGV